MRKVILIYMLLTAVLVLGACGDKAKVYLGTAEESKESSELSTEQVAVTKAGTSVIEDTTDEEAESEPENELACHVCGAVNEPGVYYLAEGSRKQDAVEAAGGFMEDAARSYVNLAERIKDGEKIYIPTEVEVEEGKVAADPVDGPAAEQDDGLVDLNKADKSELMTLPGIGETKAEAIIAYREEHGSFNSPEEILGVQGIKDGVYNKIKDKIVVD